MKSIKVLGTGCPNCIKTIKNVEKAIAESGKIIKVIKVDDIVDIMKYDILSTPGIVINEKLVFAGRVPSVDEIKELLQ